MNLPSNHKALLTKAIKDKALQMGFDACGIAKAEKVDTGHTLIYEQWLENKHHGQMHYMANHRDKRNDPTLLVPGSQSIISLAINYHLKDFQNPQSHYKVSQYAAGKDYHPVLKEKLYHLLAFIQKQTPVSGPRVFTDSAPVMERYWAQKAGLGAPGKNTCLILPRKGSYFFLAEIVVDVELEYDTPFEKDLCGKCTRCMDACPTRAIAAPGKLDARRCISYLTIELKEDIPPPLSSNTQQYIFGCDICQQVCPHNIKFAVPCSEPAFEPLPAIKEWSRETWEQMDKSTYRKNFVKTRSAFPRASFGKLKANMGLKPE